MTMLLRRFLKGWSLVEPTSQFSNDPRYKLTKIQLSITNLMQPFCRSFLCGLYSMKLIIQIFTWFMPETQVTSEISRQSPRERLGLAPDARFQSGSDACAAAASSKAAISPPPLASRPASKNFLSKGTPSTAFYKNSRRIALTIARLR